jgi:hypothetical protein
LLRSGYTNLNWLRPRFKLNDLPRQLAGCHAV